MPTMAERVIALEVEVKGSRSEVRLVRDDVAEVKGDVKALLRWRDEERGARRQRASSLKLIATALTVLTVLANVVLKVVLG